MNIFITGGAGFIGSHLAESYLAAGHSVTILDDLSTSSLTNLNAVLNHPKLTFVKGDILDDIRLEHLIQQSDCIFHLAAAVGVELVVNNPVQTITTNVLGTERVLKFASEYSKRIIIASTSEVYGKSNKIPFRESDDLLIGAPHLSRWSYACSKLLDEFMLMAYVRKSKLQGTIVRFFNTVGPRQTGRYGMVIPRFVKSALKNEPIMIYGTGQQTRCFCHVSDTVRALHAVAENLKTCGEVLNIGNTSSVSIYDLALLIKKKVASKSSLKIIPYEEAYESGFEDMIHRAPDCTKIQSLCNWRATITLDEIIEDVANYLQKNNFQP